MTGAEIFQGIGEIIGKILETGFYITAWLCMLKYLKKGE
jgi:hypothetical protein